MLCFCSSFTDIFDVDHFISSLRDEISIVKELPSEYSWSSREYYATGIRDTRIKTAPVHASANWYLENVLPILQRLVTSFYACLLSFTETFCLNIFNWEPVISVSTTMRRRLSFNTGVGLEHEHRCDSMRSWNLFKSYSILMGRYIVLSMKTSFWRSRMIEYSNIFWLW